MQSKLNKLSFLHVITYEQQGKVHGQWLQGVYNMSENTNLQ